MTSTKKKTARHQSRRINPPIGYSDQAAEWKGLSTSETKRKHNEYKRQQEIKTAIDLTLSPAAKAEMRLRDCQMHRNNCKNEYERARVQLNLTRRELEKAETQLTSERDKWRDIADTVHDQHK